MYFFRVDTSQAISLNRGVLEFVMYEGRVPAAKIASAPPMRVWRFDAMDLRRHQGKTVIGQSYRFRLGFENRPPASSSVTLSARLLRPNGKPLYAMPVLLAVAPNKNKP